jgi:hypothetical protein
LRLWGAQAERAVWALGVVVVEIGSEDSLEVSAVEDEEPVEALGADGADEALGDGVGLRCADWCAQDPDALAAEDLVERAGVLAVAVADQEADLLLGEEEAEVACLLGNPAAVRVGGTAAKLNAATAVLDEEENVEAT